MKINRLFPVLVLAGWLAGCANAPPNDGFDPVRLEVADRLDTDLDPRADSSMMAREVQNLLETPLDLPRALRLGLLNNPDLQVALAQLRLTANDLASAGLIGNPHLGGAVLDPRQGGSDLIELDLLVPLFDVITRSARMDVATGNLVEAQWNAVVSVLELASRLESAWFEWLAARAVRHMAELQAEAGAVQQLLARRFDEAGNLEPVDRALHQIIAATSRLKLLEAQSDVTARRAELSLLLGTREWQSDERLPSLPTVGITSLLPDHTVLADHPSNRLAGARIDALTRALALERRFRLLGGFDVGPAYEREPDGAGLFGLAFELELPLFNLSRLDVRAARIRLDQAGWSQRATQARLETELALARASLENASSRAKLMRNELLPAQDQLTQARLADYNYMLGGVFDLLTARREEFSAWRDYIGAVRDGHIAFARLRRAVGGNLPFPETAPLHLPELASSVDHSAMDHSQTDPE